MPAALDERRRTDPEGFQAETLTWLREGRARLEAFWRANGRRPRRVELSAILPP